MCTGKTVEKFTVLPNFMGHNVATEGDIAKTASSRPLHVIFAWFHHLR